MIGQQAQEYRYGTAARRRALLWLVGSGGLVIVLGRVLIGTWNQFGLVTQVLGVLLLLMLLFTVRAQLGQVFFRLRLLSDRIEIHAPLNRRTLAWRDVVEVRRTRLPQMNRRGRWACIVLTKTPRGSHIPTFVFDDQLERAEDAWQTIVRSTPHAQHTT